MPGPYAVTPSTPPTKKRRTDEPPPLVRQREYVAVQVADGNPNLRQRLLGRLELVAPQHPHDAGLAAMFAAVHM